nr:MAG TPA: hypothetical protein [Caudoviricetes sp.]
MHATGRFFYLTLYKTMCIIIVRKRCVCLLTINV